ncbi:MAG: hypothetical protein KC708_23790, partial [Anaerolineae bacterium]|nr:hypothetical protein [Anaerolineae bacterium]
CLWEGDGIPLTRLEGHTGAVRGVLELRDGRLLSWTGRVGNDIDMFFSDFSGNDSTPRLWGLDATPLATLEGHTAQVEAVWELRNGRLLSWSQDGTLRLWKSDGTPLATMEGYTSGVRGVLELRDGRFLSWTDYPPFDPLGEESEEDTGLWLWGPDGTHLATLEGHTNRINIVLELRDGRWLSGSQDGTLRLWASDGTPLAIMEGHTRGVYSALELRDGRLLSWAVDSSGTSLGDNKPPHLWKMEDVSHVMSKGCTNYLQGIQELADARLLSFGNWDVVRNREFRLWMSDGSVLSEIDWQEAAQLQAQELWNQEENSHHITYYMDYGDSLCTVKGRIHGYDQPFPLFILDSGLQLRPAMQHSSGIVVTAGHEGNMHFLQPNRSLRRLIGNEEGEMK